MAKGEEPVTYVPLRWSEDDESECLLCDRGVPLVNVEGVWFHVTGPFERVHCMADTHMSSRSVN